MNAAPSRMTSTAVSSSIRHRRTRRAHAADTSGALPPLRVRFHDRKVSVG